MATEYGPQMDHSGLRARPYHIGEILATPPIRKKCQKGPKWKAAYYRLLYFLLLFRRQVGM